MINIFIFLKKSHLVSFLKTVFNKTYMDRLTFLHLLRDALGESEAVCHHLHRAQRHLHLHPDTESLGDHQDWEHDHCLYTLTMINH